MTSKLRAGKDETPKVKLGRLNSSLAGRSNVTASGLDGRRIQVYTGYINRLNAYKEIVFSQIEDVVWLCDLPSSGPCCFNYRIKQTCSRKTLHT